MPSKPVTIHGTLTWDEDRPSGGVPTHPIALPPVVPTHPIILPPPPTGGGRRLISSHDLRFLGYYKFDAFSDLWYAYGQFDFRQVGADTHLLTIGNGAGHVADMWPILEYRMPQAPPHPDLAQAPEMVGLYHYGGICPYLLTGGAADQNIPGSLHWHTERDQLWWSYGDLYAPVDHCPTLGCATLNVSRAGKAPKHPQWGRPLPTPQAGSLTPFGPWRASWHTERTKGNITPIPASFADRYLGGDRIGLMASPHSASSPNGAALMGVTLPEATTPADVPFSSHVTMAGHPVILHDLEHGQTRDDRWKQCNWVERYDCNLGTTIDRGSTVFNGAVPGSSQEDGMSSAVWIDLPDKFGLLYFGNLVSTPPGMTLAHDADGLTHQWYGNYDHATSPNGELACCCHNQDDPYWITTGPGAHYRMAKGWIYNPADLVAPATGQADLWTVPVSEEFWFGAGILPAAANRVPPGFFRNARFDAATRRLYVALHGVDSFYGKARPCLAVLQVT